MSKRLEAAVKAWDHHWGDRYGDEALEEMGDEVRIALEAADAVLFSGAAVERMAEAMWLHRPLERVGMGEPKPWAELKPYQHDRYRAWASAALAALKEESNV
jgi:hypothetical protein